MADRRKSLIRHLAGFYCALALAGCGPHLDSGGQPAPGSLRDTVAGTARVAKHPDDIHVPYFARKPYEPFSRMEAVAVAVREWRLFGQRIDDTMPGTEPHRLPDQKPERMPGLWERVGEYWFEAMDAANSESAWTGKHDEFGNVFPPNKDGEYAWSAAFISYVMRIAGAADAFPYSSVHADYINQARIAPQHPWKVVALRPDRYAPQVGDLICMGRGPSRRLMFADLPTPTTFPSHCDIVVEAAPNELTVIGGNVDDAVTMKHVPVTATGMLTTGDQVPVDKRYHWFAVLEVLYDR